MKITDITVSERALPLKTPFITAKRRLDVLKYFTVKIDTDTGLRGIGGCAPTPVITGDTDGSILYALREYCAPRLIGAEVTAELPRVIRHMLAGNTSPKAALDISVYDLLAKAEGKPLCAFLGAFADRVTSDVTVSLNPPEIMTADIEKALADGFKALKIKLGGTPDEDIARIRAAADVIPAGVKARFDANQAWKAKDAVRIIASAENTGLDIELFEQPVDAHDLDGMAYVTKHTQTAILADECVFDRYDALRVIRMRAADLINIKLMKCGGIYEAGRIFAAAKEAGLGCMIGCMMEGPESVLAAAHFAAANGITLCDLDAPFLCAELPDGGAECRNGDIIFKEGAAGIGY